MKKLLLYIVVIVISTSFTDVPREFDIDQQHVLHLVNNLRARGCYCGDTFMRPVGPLKWDKDLYRSAVSHAKEMERFRYFSHYNKNGQDIGERLDLMGYEWQVAGENLGEGQRNFTEVLGDWKDSKSHCKMLMNGKVKDMAVARFGKYWVQHFGKRLPPNAIVSKTITKTPE
jgi:uncharacterized protein YkwD